MQSKVGSLSSCLTTGLKTMSKWVIDEKKMYKKINLDQFLKSFMNLLMIQI